MALIEIAQMADRSGHLRQRCRPGAGEMNGLPQAPFQVCAEASIFFIGGMPLIETHLFQYEQMLLSRIDS